MLDAIINGTNNFFRNPFRNRYEGAYQGFVLANFLVALFITRNAKPEHIEYLAPIVFCFVMGSTISGSIIGYFHEDQVENAQIRP